MIHIRRGVAVAKPREGGTLQFRGPKRPAIPTLTRVSLVFIPGRMNVYLRFGHASQQRLINGRCRSVFFPPNCTFCRIWWKANVWGTTGWQLAILQTRPPGRFVQRLAGISPGASILLEVEGERDVQLLLRLISAIEAQGVDPSKVPASFWRTVHNRLVARAEGPAYTPLRHMAVQRREALS